MLLQQAGWAEAVACAALPAEDTSAAAAVSELTAAAGSLAAVASRSFESAEAEAAAVAAASASASGHVAAGAAQQFVMILTRVVPENGRRQPDGTMCVTSGDCAYTAWLVHYREGAARLSLQCVQCLYGCPKPDADAAGCGEQNLLQVLVLRPQHSGWRTHFRNAAVF